MHDIRLCVQYANTHSPIFDGNVISIYNFGDLQFYFHTNIDFFFVFGIAFKSRMKQKALKRSEYKYLLFKLAKCQKWVDVSRQKKKQSQFFNFHLSYLIISLDIL